MPPTLTDLPLDVLRHILWLRPALCWRLRSLCRRLREGLHAEDHFQDHTYFDPDLLYSIPLEDIPLNPWPPIKMGFRLAALEHYFAGLINYRAKAGGMRSRASHISLSKKDFLVWLKLPGRKQLYDEYTASRCKWRARLSDELREILTDERVSFI